MPKKNGEGTQEYSQSEDFELLQKELKVLKDRLSTLESLYKSGTAKPPMDVCSGPRGMDHGVVSEFGHRGRQSADLGHNAIANPVSPLSMATNKSILKFTTEISPLGKNPIDNFESEFSFHKFYSPFVFGINKRKFTGPLGWASLLKADAATSNVITYMMKLDRIRRSELFAIDKNTDKVSAKSFGRKLQENGVPDELKPLNTIRPQPLDIKDAQVAKSKINERALSLGLTFYEGGIDKELALIDKIELVLPNKKVIWALITRFFTNLYPSMPILDENDFRSTISKYIGLESNAEESVELKIVRKMDFAYLGTLLVVLRFSYLSLFTNSYDINQNNFSSHDTSHCAQEIRYLLSNPISIDVIDIAELCLEQFNIMKSLKLPLLQFALFLRIYRVYSPEDGEGSDDTSSAAFTNKIIQMCYFMGLHRESDSIPGEIEDERTNNLCRKIWYYMILIDFQDSLANGTPLAIPENSYDTKLPYYKIGNENVRDVELELIAVRGSLKLVDVIKKASGILRFICEVKDFFKLKDLTEKLTEFEQQILGEHKRVFQSYSYTPVDDDADYRAFESNFFKSKTGMFYCTLYTFVININVHLFNYFERKGDMELSFFYMKKSLFIAIHEIMPIYTEVLRRGPNLFHRSTDLVITPQLETAVHRSLMVLQGLTLRARYSIRAMKSAADPHYIAINELIKASNRGMKLLLDIVAKLRDRYYFAWRLTKVGAFVYQILNEEKLYNTSKVERPLKMTTSMVQELTQLISEGIKIIPDSPPNALGGKSETVNFKYDVNSAHENGINAMDLPCFASSTTPASEGPAPKNQDIDDLWMQMMSVKHSPFGGYEELGDVLEFKEDDFAIPDVMKENFEYFNPQMMEDLLRKDND